MKVEDLMSKRTITVSPGESVEVAARMLTHYNIGALPVCGSDGKLHGLVTDRDLIVRCVATNRDPGKTKVKDVMTAGVISVKPSMDAALAAHLMGKQQIRRLPVVEEGILCGMISLGDLANEERYSEDAAGALADISSNLR